MNRMATLYYAIVGGALALCVVVLVVEWIRGRMRR